MAIQRITPTKIVQMKFTGEKVTMLTAYDFLTARILDEVGIDIILVGDSLGMVFSGYETTIPVTLEEMIYHTKAVSRGAKMALVVGDMPFMSYQVNQYEAVRNAGRFLQEGGAQAVKLEGGTEMADTIKRIVDLGIPAMGHIGLTPQSIHKLGGYRVQGTDEQSARYLLDSTKALEQAGIFSLVLEAVPKQIAKEISESISVPTIGIGAGVHCNGQVLVTEDLLGLFDIFRPKFVRRYAHLAQTMREACKKYIEDVKGEKFPSDKESY